MRVRRRAAVPEQTSGAFLLNGTGLWLGRPHRRVIGEGEGLLLTAHGLRYWRFGRSEHHSWAGFRCVRVEYLDRRALSSAQRRREWLLLLQSALLSPGATGPPRATPVAVTVWFPAPGDERSIQSLPFWREPLSELEQAAVIDTFALFRRDPARAEVLADLAAVRASLHRLAAGEAAATAWRR